ncbi:hypothetical protein BBK36DRAFT_1112489 [Trichoderma citrinoviride]|uniref:WSC domain-containing protein n=1 Tax=Trichoderma citrinoviride TaxID=58853 RepID=A0A2T4BIQ1_9HYPO|nr:hypothetical protein BBK36DRAFT_1112489 [Trichoderma citrinoviride]PTB69196.1 hypothetical protein BBK36DRAFT_1112489 [Trichoderma citrinoviride]
MHLPLIIALGAQLTLGHYSNSSAPHSHSHTHKDDTAHQPWVIGDFRFVGCAASTAGFPLFRKVVSTDFMNLDFCAASCPGRFFGTYNTDCYCGDELDMETAGKVDADLCDTPCPGDECQTCGGLTAAARLAREKERPLSVILSLYIRLGEDLEYHHDDGHEHEHAWAHDPPHQNNGWKSSTQPPHPPSQRTYTHTITSTTTSTITSCAPGVPHCPIGNKVTQAVTLTTELCPTPEWHRKKIICYGDHCAPEEPCRDDGDGGELHCQRQRVVCNGESCHTEICADTDDEWHRLVVCDDSGSECRYRQCAANDDDECNDTKVVCYDGNCAKEPCWGDECRRNFVCRGTTECRHEVCEGGEEEGCHEFRVCGESGTDCHPQPLCSSGLACPVPPPPLSKTEPPFPTQHHEASYAQPVAPTNGHGLPRPTGAPVVAGSTKLGATVFSVLLSFVVFL